MKSNIKKILYILFFVIIITIIGGHIYNTYISPDIEGFENNQPVIDNSTKDNTDKTDKTNNADKTNNTDTTDNGDDLDKIVASLGKSAKTINNNTDKFIDSVNKLGKYVDILTKTKESFTSNKNMEEEDSDNKEDYQNQEEEAELEPEEEQEDNSQNKENLINKDIPIKEGFTQNKNENKYTIQGYDSYIYDGYYMKL
jgi:hypothetical protein